MVHNVLPAVALLTQAEELVRRRAALHDAAPAPAPKITVLLDEAATVLADPASPAHALLAELVHLGRTAGVREPQLRLASEQLRLPGRQYPTLAGLTAAIERGEA